MYKFSIMCLRTHNHWKKSFSIDQVGYNPLNSTSECICCFYSYTFFHWEKYFKIKFLWKFQYINFSSFWNFKIYIYIYIHTHIYWRRQWLPTPVFWPGKIPWTEEFGGRSQTWLITLAYMYIYICVCVLKLLSCVWLSAGPCSHECVYIYTHTYIWKSLSHVQLSGTPWTVACQAPPSMEFSRPEYWSG